MDIYLIFLFIVLVIYILSMVFVIFIYKKNIKNNQIPVQVSNITIEEILKDLDTLIKYKCENLYQKVLLPLKNKTLGNSDAIITDDILDSLTLETSKEIIDQLSDNYKEKIYMVIKREKFEEFIINLVYDKISNIVIQMNKESVRKIMKF